MIRTESSHIHNTAELDAYKECGFEEYEFMASLGERTCEVCGGMDGKRIKLTDKQFGVNFPPLHPNCRCTTIAFDPDDDLTDFKDRLENGELNYDKWYAKYVEGREQPKLESKDGTEIEVPEKPVPVSPTSEKKTAVQTLTTGGDSGIIFTDKQRGKKFGKHCADWGLDPSVSADRGKLEAIIRDMYNNPDEVRIGKFNYQADDTVFKIKGEDVLVHKSSGEFITILRGGISDAWVKNARKLET